MRRKFCLHITDMIDFNEFKELASHRLKELNNREKTTKIHAKKPEIIRSPQTKDIISSEITAIPQNQHLLNYREFSVYYAFKHQIPETVIEISRLREVTYRALDEGSGKEIDSDRYDENYTHLFVFDNTEKKIVGAYRLGQTDKILSGKGCSDLYLWQTYKFSKEYQSRIFPALEMGRSFIAPEYQGRAYSLFLLWKGIGVFLIRNPRYRTLYGTVSLSLQYHPLSISLIESVLVTNQHEEIKPIESFENVTGERLHRLLQQHDIDFSALSKMIQTIEPDNKSVPVMLKQYYRLGAKFHCVGIDKNFSGTPGLLLDVYMPEGPATTFSRFFDNNEVERYKEYNETKNH